MTPRSVTASASRIACSPSIARVSIQLPLFVFAIILLVSPLMAQTTNNVLITPNTATGPSLPIPYDGTSEKVNLASGDLSIQIPLLSLPQRGGGTFSIGIAHDSKASSINVNGTIVNVTPGAPYGTSYGIGYQPSYQTYIPMPGNPYWRLTIPTLVVFRELDGWEENQAACVGAGCYSMPYWCDHYVYADPDGTQYNFANAENCQWGDFSMTYYSLPSHANRPIHVSYLAGQEVRDNTAYTSFDRSGLGGLVASSIASAIIKLDTTNQNDVVVTKPDGTIIHFFSVAATIGPRSRGAMPTAFPFSSIVDRNGNMITQTANYHLYQIGYDISLAFTDTVGRTITVDSTGITYPDPSTGTRTIAWSSTTTPTSQMQLSPSGCHLNTPTGMANLTANNFQGSTQTSSVITLPDSGVLGFTNNALGELQEIQYPQGGYKRFTYSTYTIGGYGNNSGPVACTGIDTRQITNKFECSSGSCGCATSTSATACTGENRTSYSPNPLSFIPNNAQLGANQSNTVDYYDFSPSSALLKEEVQNFAIASNGVTLQTSSQLKDGQLNVIRTTTPNYTSASIPYPASTATTLNDGVPNVSSTVSYGYAQVVAPFAIGPEYTRPGSNTESAIFGSPTSVTYSDFSGNTLKKTTTTYQWQLDPSYGAWQSNISSAGAYLLDLPASTSLTLTPGTTTSYIYTDSVTSLAGTSAPGIHRGNLLSSTVNGTDTTNYTTWDTGSIASVSDTLAQKTSYTYDSSFSFLQSVQNPTTNGVQHITSYKYDDVTGKQLSVTDENNQTTNYYYEDPLWRLTTVQLPATPPSTSRGGSTFSHPSQTESDEVDAVSATGGVSSTKYLDGFGRVSRTVGAGIAQDTTYDALGRVHCQSNPYPSGGTCPGKTCYQYDVLDRVTLVTNPDTSTRSTTYKGPFSLSKDENGNQKVSEMDALGRLVSVCEITTQADAAGNSPSACPGPFSVSGFITRYSYDSAGNLTGVTQGNQTRTFNYDSFSRLIDATNPESGKTTSSYRDDSGARCSGNPSDLCKKTDARSASISYKYDALYRVTDKTASDGVSTHFDYDTSSESSSQFTVGRLTYEQNSLNGTLLAKRAIYNYDPMGRVQGEWQCVRENCTSHSFPLSYQYNLLGQVTQSSNGLPSFSPASINYTSWYDDTTSYLTQVSSSLSEDKLHPSILFQTSPSNYGPHGLLNANLGSLSTQPNSPAFWLSRVYDPITTRLQAEVNSGNIGGTFSSATITITGSEQSGGYATGTVTVSGSEQAVPATNSSGSITISGTLQSKPTQSAPGTSGSGSFTVYQNAYYCSYCSPQYNSGTISLIVGSYTATVNYGQRSNTNSIAYDLAASLNSSGLVSAKASGTTVTMTAKATGAATNYALSVSYTFLHPTFPMPGYTLSIPGSLTGGKDPTTSTLYDSGVSSIVINGQSLPYAWSGSGTTTSTIASGLASVLNSYSWYVRANASGNVVTFTSSNGGPSVNYSFSSSSTYDSANFSRPSFSSSNSGSTMTGGKDPVYDSGTASIIINGVNYSAAYGQGATPSTIATSLASVIGTCSTSSTASATASGAVVSLVSCRAGTPGNYPLAASSTYSSSTFSSPSFSTSTSGSALSGGNSGAAVYDSGTITVNVGSATASANYSQGSTPASLATILASGLNSSGIVNVSSSGGTLQIHSLQSGSSSNYPISSSVVYNTTNFTAPSFSVSPSSGALSGGVNNTSTAMYSYSLGYYPNGNLQSVSESVMGTWTYGYDSLNRLTRASASSGPYNTLAITYPYDRYGNRWTVSLTGNPPTPLFAPTAMTFSSSGNRVDQITAVSGYDVAGNVVYEPNSAATYTYSAEGQLVTAQSNTTKSSYLYDAEGRRVAKLNGTSLTSSPITNVYILGTGGEQLSELDGSLNWLHSNVYVADKLLATYDSAGTHFQFADWLGSRRFQVRADGLAALQCSSLPFGDNLGCAVPNGFALSDADSTEHHFTGKERDSETTNDFFEARYFNSLAGRFLSPDPESAGADQDNPQSWNGYAYSLNNPLNTTDPDGRIPCPPDDPNCKVKIEVHDNLEDVQTLTPETGSRLLDQIKDSAQRGLEMAKQYISAPRDPGCMATAMATGATVGGVTGGIAGGIAGGTGGTLVAPGVGTVGGGVAGAVEGTKDGAMLGTAIGGVYGFVACKSGGGGSGGGGGGGKQGKFWKGLKNFRQNIKTNGLKGSAKRFFQWDYTHGDVEVYNGQGQHLGSADPETGVITKPAVPGRSITI